MTTVVIMKLIVMRKKVVKKCNKIITSDNENENTDDYQ